MWRFYAIEAGRLDLLPHTTYFAEPPTAAAPGSKLLCPADSPRCTALSLSSSWREVMTVPSLDGTRSFIILERTAAGGD